MDNVIPFTFRSVSKRKPISREADLVEDVTRLEQRLCEFLFPRRVPPELHEALRSLESVAMRLTTHPCQSGDCDCSPGDPNGCRAEARSWR